MLTAQLSRSDCQFFLQAATLSLFISYENLVLDQDNNLYLISFSILIAFLLDSEWILWEEVTYQSLRGINSELSILTFSYN